jgi:hypothetical protein
VRGACGLKLCNYSPDFKTVAAISSLNKLIFADLVSCHPLVGGAFFW